MTFLARILLSGLLLACGGAATAQERLVVVELYTSQGCSSCPPADRLLVDIEARPNVLPLSLHVDYWDYIGWKDQFADPRFTQRQKAYAKVAGERMIYTPQMIVNGQARVVGSRAMEVMDALQAHAASAPSVAVSLTRSGDRMAVEASPLGPLTAPVAMVVQLVRYTPHAQVDIHGGENEGRSVTYINVVRDWSVIGEWDGSGRWSGHVPLDGPAAVIVQEKGQGAVLGAARLD